uniref:(northern house mosquito) hypothetical protein n=1 Tax=Culex pipiens TaxID=7175 RepID=A0A8D8A411_CULPI
MCHRMTARFLHKLDNVLWDGHLLCAFVFLACFLFFFVPDLSPQSSFVSQFMNREGGAWSWGGQLSLYPRMDFFFLNCIISAREELRVRGSRGFRQEIPGRRLSLLNQPTREQRKHHFGLFEASQQLSTSPMLSEIDILSHSGKHLCEES